MRTRLLATALACFALASALAAGEAGFGARPATWLDSGAFADGRESADMTERTAWIHDSTLGTPFALVALPPGFSAEGNVAWNHMAPVPMYSMWISFACPLRRVAVEIAFPVAPFHEGAGAPARHDAAGALRSFVLPLLAAAAPGAKAGEITESAASPLLAPTRLELAKAEAMFQAAGRAVRDARAEAAELAVVSGELRTRISAGVWSFLAGPLPAAPGMGDSALGKWTGLLCVTAPAGLEVPGAEVRALLDGITINPAWQAEAARKLAAIVEWPHADFAREKAKAKAMNRSGAVLVRPARPPGLTGYAPPPAGAAPAPASGRYTYVNAVLDGCFFGVRTGPARVDVGSVGSIGMFP